MTLKQRAESRFDEIYDDLKHLSRWMYENPETAHQEVESSRRLADLLANRGFEVEIPAYGLDTAFEANLGSSGPKVVLCAEYDALPEVGHACGHNIIATSSAGAGIALAPLVEEMGIRLTVLGTPAEEGGGGKIDLLKAGAFEDAALAMLIHPSRRNTVDPHLIAAQGFTATFRGRESHAASTPHLGINALDAAIQAYNSVSTLRQQFEEGDRVHGVITEGGVAPNVIPAVTASKWIVRAATATRFAALRTKVLACFEAAATATGCSLEIEYEGDPYLDLVSNETLAGLFAENASRLGRAMAREADHLEPTAASSDMGNVSHVVPSLHPSVGIETDAVNHQPEFAASTVTESGEEVIRDGALAMAWTVIDVATGDLWESLR